MLIVNNNSVGASVLINDEILKRKNKHYKTLAGKTGKIYGVWEDNISVKLKDVVNNNSQYGYFYFKPNELEILDDNKQTNERKNNMNTENPNNYKGNYRVAKIRFLDSNSNEMTYRIYEDGFDYDINSLVVVKPANHNMNVAKIVEIYDTDSDLTCSCDREIVCPIDTSKYKEREARAKEIVKLKKEMDKKVQELQGIALYELMAKTSPELKDMLDRFTELTQPNK